MQMTEAFAVRKTDDKKHRNNNKWGCFLRESVQSGRGTAPTGRCFSMVLIHGERAARLAADGAAFEMQYV